MRALTARFSRGALLALGCAAVACAQPRDESGRASGCAARVIVTLMSAPDEALVADLQRVSGARLEWLRAMTTNLHLFTLAADGPEPACSAAIERLRSDPRVRAVDLDERRRVQRP